MPTTEAPEDALVGAVPVPGAPDPAASEVRRDADRIGKSPLRRGVGLVGQYGALVVLAAVVLIPIGLTVITALSPPFSYVSAGLPLHPVAVDWADRTWWTGGLVSVVVRTALVIFALAWVQLHAAGGSWRDPRPLLTVRRLVAVGLGAVAVAVLSGEVYHALVTRSSATTTWIIVFLAVLVATQVLGLVGPERPAWAAVVLAACTGVGIGAFVIIAFGATVWGRAWAAGDLGPAMMRSLAMSVLIVGFQLVTSVLAAYAFAFLRFPLKRTIFALFMATLLLPIEVTLLANTNFIRELGWIDSMQGLVLPFAAFAFGTFLLRQGFLGIPKELRDATRLDGYGHVNFLWRFAVPLTRPVVAAFALISALYAWNQYIWPLAVTDTTQHQTLQIRLATVAATEVVNANQGIAAALLAAIPILVLLVIFQRHIIRGLTAGAVKG